MKKLIWLLLLTQTVAFADDSRSLNVPIPVESNIPYTSNQVGKSVDVIDHSIIEDYKLDHLTDNIQNVQGVWVKDIFGLTTVRIRGARAIDTKVLYNGMPLNDPSDVQGSSNPLLYDLTGNGIDSLEILRGASSTVWGSGAVGGVINIVPIKDKNYLEGTFEGGSKGTYKEEVSGSKYGVTGSIERLNSYDNYGNTNGIVNIDLNPIQDIRLEGDILSEKTHSIVPDGPIIQNGVLFTDARNPNNTRDYELNHEDLKLTIGSDERNFQSKVGYTDSYRRFEFLPDTDGFYEGKDFIVDNSLNFEETDNLRTSIGWQYNQKFMEIFAANSDIIPHSYSNDYYVEQGAQFGNLDLLLGLRDNTQESVKSRLTYDVSSVYHLDTIHSRLKAHYGTAFRSPSLYELYGAFLSAFGTFPVGNPLLSPERSASFDLGVETQLGETTNFGITFFENSITNKIDFVGLSYSNIEGDSRTHGIEAYAEQYLSKNLSARATYTLTEGSNLIDVPRSEVGGSLRYSNGKWNANIRGTYESANQFQVFNLDDFLVENLSEKGHIKLDSTVSYKVTPNVELFGRVDNVLNEHYKVSGYRGEGFGVYAGVKVKL